MVFVLKEVVDCMITLGLAGLSRCLVVVGRLFFVVSAARTSLRVNSTASLADLGGGGGVSSSEDGETFFFNSDH